MLDGQKCFYCGADANFQLRNKRYCCCKSFNSCPDTRKKISERQKGPKNHRFGEKPWNIGLTKESDIRVEKYVESMIKTKSENYYVAWNKGLNKEDDDRIKKYAEACSKTKLGVPNYKLRKPINKSRAKTTSRFRHLFKKRLYSELVFPILKNVENKNEN